jgi:hypothetical protein
MKTLGVLSLPTLARRILTPTPGVDYVDVEGAGTEVVNGRYWRDYSSPFYPRFVKPGTSIQLYDTGAPAPLGAYSISDPTAPFYSYYEAVSAVGVVPKSGWTAGVDGDLPAPSVVY